jgi:hypothetical protein
MSANPSLSLRKGPEVDFSNSVAVSRPALRAQGVETSDARQNHTQPNRSPERTLTMSTSLKIAAATLLALFASCLTTTSAQAQHRSNRISGIVRDVFDVIADELEDYEEDYEDEYDDYEEDYEDEFDYEQNERGQDRFPSIERGPNQSTLNRLPPGFIGQWRVLTPPGIAGAAKGRILLPLEWSHHTRHHRQLLPCSSRHGSAPTIPLEPRRTEPERSVVHGPIPGKSVDPDQRPRLGDPTGTS